MIPYGRQDIRQSDIDAILDVLNSDFLTQGPQVPLFEAALAEQVNARHAVAVNSATSALHIACLALGLGPGDILWTTPNTFVASANCGLYCGATVDFVDIDARTFNMDVEKLEAKLKAAAQNGTLPKIVIPVDLCGQPAELKAIRVLADRYDFKIIEDASHAIGAKYENQSVGDGRYADVTVFSFHPVKIITTAEGGMAVTNSKELAQKMCILRSHGITRDTSLMTSKGSGPWYYEQVDLGFNYRMTELQGALGVSQLSRLNEYVSTRCRLADQYNSLLNGVPVKLPFQAPGTQSSWHLYVVQLQEAELHRAVFEALREADIGVNLHYIPVHCQPYYRSLGFKLGDFPVSEDYYSRSISLPLYPLMTDEQQLRVVSELDAALTCANA